MKFYKSAFFLVVICCAALNINAQSVKVNANNQPLNEVFIKLQKTYGIQLSFNDKLLSECIVSDSTIYITPKQAITSLLSNCNLAYELNNDVFIIYPSEYSEVKLAHKNKPNIFAGHISDLMNTEPLPFSNLQIDNSGLIADASGNFAIKSQDSTIYLKVSYVGYYLLDTTLFPGTNQHIKLTPSTVGLKEVVINSNATLYNTHIGEKSGLIKLNHKVAPFLPGNNDNTIFNLLRLQPGILAAGEQANDVSIWGSYKGQTLVLFDGIPLFNISSFDNKIGVINPQIIKDIEVLKGGFNAHIGERVGGIVNITGKSGNLDKITANLNLNNQTLNGIISIPIAGKYTLQASFRQTYNQLLNWQNISGKEPDYKLDTYNPKFQFKDMNLKFTGITDKGDNYYLSLLGNNDAFSYEYSDNSENRHYVKWNEVTKQQLGGSFFYSKNWERTGITNTRISYSSLESSIYDTTLYENFHIPQARIKRISYITNSISEMSVKTDHYFPTVKRHNISIGLGYTNNTTAFEQDTIAVTRKSKIEYANRISTYFKDNISVFEKISVQPGLRIDYQTNISKPYIQPRIDATIKTFEGLKFNLAWGVFNQFITESSLVDDLGNQWYHWNICDDKIIAVLRGIHNIAGFSYENKGFNFTAEGFYKITKGLSRTIHESRNSFKMHTGQSKSLGVDFFVKKDFKKHDFWIAYTLSKTEEYFSYFKTSDYQLSPQDQRHEVKAATLLNFSPYFISLNYVYGSGLANSARLSRLKEVIPYKRFDIAFLYKFNTKKIKLETGLSIVNVLNTKNVGYYNISNLPGNKTIYSSATPFTPTVFLNIGF